MLEVKRKLDFIFLIIVTIVLLIGIFYQDAIAMAIGVAIGFVATSITMEKDVRRAADHMPNIWLNIGVNILVYAVALGGAMLISQTVFVFAAIGLLGYRNLLLIKIRKVED
jgi:hypothetical protein